MGSERTYPGASEDQGLDHGEPRVGSQGPDNINHLTGIKEQKTMNIMGRLKESLNLDANKSVKKIATLMVDDYDDVKISDLIIYLKNEIEHYEKTFNGVVDSPAGFIMSRYADREEDILLNIRESKNPREEYKSYIDENGETVPDLFGADDSDITDYDELVIQTQSYIRCQYGIPVRLQAEGIARDIVYQSAAEGKSIFDFFAFADSTLGENDYAPEELLELLDSKGEIFNQFFDAKKNPNRPRKLRRFSDDGF